MDQESEILYHAETVAGLVRAFGHDVLVIGAVALAAHHYVRLTNDLDLGGNIPLDHLRELACILVQ